jgi:hypothetical protein
VSWVVVNCSASSALNRLYKVRGRFSWGFGSSKKTNRKKVFINSGRGVEEVYHKNKVYNLFLFLKIYFILL